MRQPGKLIPKQAFSVTELIASIAAFALLALIALPALGINKPQAQRAACLNNLRQIGKAFHIWGTDHEDNTPWNVGVQYGGTGAADGGFVHPLAGNAWFQFSWISNELVTPKILVCPSDNQKIATDFSTNAAGGFLNSNFRSLAVSYFIGLSARPYDPFAPLSGDRNITFDGIGSTSIGINNAKFINLPTSTLSWTDGLHQSEGDVLRMGGDVLQLTSSALKYAFNQIERRPRYFLLLPR